MSGRRPTARLLVTPETAAALDEALIDTISITRQKVSKTDLADALIRIGLRHLDEVAALITQSGEGEVTTDDGSGSV